MWLSCTLTSVIVPSLVALRTIHGRDLLGLLTSGVNEAAIAGAFGCSVRTVTRQVRGIMKMTGADNHFQAGMEASRRGWV